MWSGAGLLIGKLMKMSPPGLSESRSFLSAGYGSSMCSQNLVDRNRVEGSAHGTGRHVIPDEIHFAIGRDAADGFTGLKEALFAEIHSRNSAAARIPGSLANEQSMARADLEVVIGINRFGRNPLSKNVYDLAWLLQKSWERRMPSRYFFMNGLFEYTFASLALVFDSTLHSGGASWRLFWIEASKTLRRKLCNAYQKHFQTCATRTASAPPPEGRHNPPSPAAERQSRQYSSVPSGGEPRPAAAAEPSCTDPATATVPVVFAAGTPPPTAAAPVSL